MLVSVSNYLRNIKGVVSVKQIIITQLSSVSEQVSAHCLCQAANSLFSLNFLDVTASGCFQKALAATVHYLSSTKLQED